MPKHAAVRAPRQLNGSRGTAVANRAPSPSWVSGWRQKIRTSQIINRLQMFGLDDPDNPTGPRLTRTQAQVLLSLLRKVLPDMQALEITGAEGQPIQVQVLRFSDVEGANVVIDAEPQAKPLTQLLQIEDSPRLIEDEPPDDSPRMTKRAKRSQ